MWSKKIKRQPTCIQSWDSVVPIATGQSSYGTIKHHATEKYVPA